MIINFDFAFSKHVAVTWLGGNGRVVSGFSGYLFDENLLIGDFSLFEFKLQFIEFRARVSCWCFSILPLIIFFFFRGCWIVLLYFCRRLGICVYLRMILIANLQQQGLYLFFVRRLLLTAVGIMEENWFRKWYGDPWELTKCILF